MISVFKRELVGYFKNATAYVIFAIYTFLSAMFFCRFVLLNNTSYLGELFGYYLFLVEIVVVSILAMRFFSEEKKNKTEQLLYTAPVRLSGVVIGKYLAGMVVYLGCTLVNLVYVLIIDFLGDPDTGSVFTSFLGTVLLGSAMVAIALFISSLTENPLLAAGGTAASFVLSFLMGTVASFLASWLGQGGLWFTDGVAGLNLFNWFNEFAGGIVPLTSVIFYISITAVFLFLTVRVLERRRWS
ncbi:MAG: ABC transporter permease subunit [Clostridia bacterium]|nr:ABC transporter permease subunit [Clostridia bacterium]